MTTASLYNTHCKTFAIAQQIMECGNITKGDHPFHGFRCFPRYRTESGRALRSMVFQAVKAEMAANGGKR